jgi:hypothetical protein
MRSGQAQHGRRIAAWRIPPLNFAHFLFGCSADTKPYMDCAAAARQITQSRDGSNEPGAKQ